ncbi:MAG TPA: hypothetical protein VGC78_07355 [Gaiellaceae bacterium]
MRWERVSTPAGAFAGAPGDDAAWRPVELPAHGGDDEDHWFRARVEVANAHDRVRLGGLATVCDVYVDGVHVLRSESMFASHDLEAAPGTRELVVCARALEPILAERRKPRARWRTRVADNNLRWIRTTLLGRAPGFAPGPPVVGPWRPVTVVDGRSPRLHVVAALDGDDGVVEIRCATGAGPLTVQLGDVEARLPAGGGVVRVPSPALWWPHTHGTPALHDLRVRTAHAEVLRRVGFRRLETDGDGLHLRVNGIPVFARGAVWTPQPPEEVRPTLERARAGGLNLIRVVGTMTYEDAAFHDACDELGLLVWQDLMFANMDYPFVDDDFRGAVESELADVLRELAGRPSTAVVCGNSEVEQQVAMLGLDPKLARDPFYVSTVPALLEAAGVDAAYVPSAPSGGTFPFRTSSGVANYFGVGAYRRPLSDARLARVQFASECLAFANVPDTDADRSAGVMRDAGADWDFADVRDHYLRELHGAGPGDDLYWELSRHVTGELMARVFGEWRRPGSTCGGGIVLWLRDLRPGSGWGILDADGAPKLAWHHLRRALEPVAVWLTDEGLDGLAIHVANDGPEEVEATLRLSLYRDESVRVDEAAEPFRLAPHAAVTRDAEGLLGRFVDVGYAYRFGEVQHDTVVATIERPDGRPLSQAFFYPVGAARERRLADELGLRVDARAAAAGVEVLLESDSVVHGVRVRAAGTEPADDGFDLEPGRARTVTLHGAAVHAAVTVTALNLVAPLDVEVA